MDDQPTRLPNRVDDGPFVLRRWELDDAEAMAEAITDSIEHLRLFMGWIAHEPQMLEQRRALIVGFNAGWMGGGDVVLAMLLDGRVVGGTGLHRRGGANRLDIGYWVRSDSIGRGLAARASRLLTSVAFGVPGVDTVEIHHDKANVHSRAVPEQLGFEFAGETPEATTSPVSGIDCTWRMNRQRWQESG
ncbi:MAG: GNAT family N-acetyltransferase [Acidimicrobiia bacterium]|nr:GNAT family N-acetyltransferase [Acidimicrobiia bacterium]